MTGTEINALRDFFGARCAVDIGEVVANELSKKYPPEIIMWGLGACTSSIVTSLNETNGNANSAVDNFNRGLDSLANSISHINPGVAKVIPPLYLRFRENIGASEPRPRPSFDIQ